MNEVLTNEFPSALYSKLAQPYSTLLLLLSSELDWSFLLAAHKENPMDRGAWWAKSMGSEESDMT